MDWHPDDLWLLELVNRQTAIPPAELQDWRWWNALRKLGVSLNQRTIEREFARMEVWLIENPSRRPKSRWKKFVKFWLFRAHNESGWTEKQRERRREWKR